MLLGRGEKLDETCREEDPVRKQMVLGRISLGKLSEKGIYSTYGFIGVIKRRYLTVWD